MIDIDKEFDTWISQNIKVVDGEIKVYRKTMSGVMNVGVSIDIFEDAFHAAANLYRERLEKAEKVIEHFINYDCNGFVENLEFAIKPARQYLSKYQLQRQGVKRDIFNG